MRLYVGSARNGLGADEAKTARVSYLVGLGHERQVLGAAVAVRDAQSQANGSNDEGGGRIYWDSVETSRMSRYCCYYFPDTTTQSVQP